ncbi:hypothetical protein DV736_g6090, partial [Chaetothyriales sp. CBS 134916]
MKNVQRSVMILLRLGTLMVLLIPIASIVTPLGLSDTVLPSSSAKPISFPYIADVGPFGYGTPPRSNVGFNRICGYFGLIACPGSDTVQVASGDGSETFPNGYDASIPKSRFDTFQSGLSELPQTVSSFFDIQWRSYGTKQDPNTNHGQITLVGNFRQLGTLILDNVIEAVEGLLVDTIDGAVAFRNHTVPENAPLGATWSEDLFVVEPDTQCVNTNLTVDFTLPGLNGSNSINVQDLALIDRGGFVNIPRTHPRYNVSSPQVNADLSQRALEAAWLFNMMTAVYMNVTNLEPQFEYLESKIGQSFPMVGETLLQNDAIDIRPYDYFFSTFIQNDANENFSSSGLSAEWPNPFNVTLDDFQTIAPRCQGDKTVVNSNMSNIAVGCGLLYGAPKLQDGSTSIVFEAGTKWTMPIYSCATAVKVTVKTFSFRFNGTEGLKSLNIESVQDSNKTLTWGIENNNGMDMIDVPPLWGLVSSATKPTADLDVVKSPYLYLPGTMTPFGSGLGEYSTDNLPGAQFAEDVINAVYDGSQINGGGVNGIADYSGKSSFAMFVKWQQLASSTAGAGRIINLIFTDLTANALVGTKSWLATSTAAPVGKRDTATPSAQVAVTEYERYIRYNWLYGVPSYVVVLISAVIGTATLILLLLGKATLSKMKAYLKATSPGRTLTMFLYPGECEPQQRTRTWVRSAGAKTIRIGRPSWIPQATGTVVHPGRKIRVNGGSGPHGYEHDQAPLIDKPGAAIQMTPVHSPSLGPQGQILNPNYAGYGGPNQHAAPSVPYPHGGFAQ